MQAKIEQIFARRENIYLLNNFCNIIKSELIFLALNIVCSWKTSYTICNQRSQNDYNEFGDCLEISKRVRILDTLLL